MSLRLSTQLPRYIISQILVVILHSQTSNNNAENSERCYSIPHKSGTLVSDLIHG